ncbi:glycosyltransferase family 2 protein [Flavobacterium nitrogenifigens]|uniref:Glycosyltransferase, GT2 family n=1 Tax=Flavobacterium nitrogenifigens TaxID=1617283 RepID=A0A521EE64_9FLAO|nr:glycosyltransferase [Flavobacterium nitrogenifigens]KAF2325963.1 glycosyltransferase family 2 protein [Flavobacterium nitrogenifigens]SMO82209.1 Glycosyltransferase, GT2 family [Flavobacterium nitrogenifigens]
MKFSLIICTYMRPEPLLKLLISVQNQVLCPNEILIIDGSLNDRTKLALDNKEFKNLKYFLVSDQERGLTKQRNFGISKLDPTNDIVCFLDDDIILEPNYFQNLLNTYLLFPEALGAGGYIANEIKWDIIPENYKFKSNEFYYDGWKRKDGSRFVLRKKLNLDSNTSPGFSPNFSHGRSVGFLPPSGKIYESEQLMGGVSSFRKSVFKEFSFSTYFEGYGLYEDADFCLRLAKKGKLYLNTEAKLNHYHDPAGRPNQFHYGKMVVRNGWYVWRTKNPNPILKDRLKWNAITFLLILIRFTNVINGVEKKAAFIEAIGRVVGCFSLILNKPKK